MKEEIYTVITEEEHIPSMFDVGAAFNKSKTFQSLPAD